MSVPNRFSSSKLKLSLGLLACLFGPVAGAQQTERTQLEVAELKPAPDALQASIAIGASNDAGATWQTSFSSTDQIAISALIDIDPAHVGISGNIYVLVSAEGAVFMQVSGGAFLPWPGTVESLQPARFNQLLAAQETLEIIPPAALGRLGLADTSLDIYLAYDVATEPDNLIFTDSPLSISIAAYAPQEVAFDTAQTLETVVIDTDRERELPVLIYLPETNDPAPVVLFSHGLGGSVLAATFLGHHWAGRGYLVLFMQHPGSDSSILEGVPPSGLLAAFNAAASAQNLILRIGDVSAIIDQLELWNIDPEHELYQRMNLEQLGMSGHSFGARTTQTTSGEIVPWLPYATKDPRIKAAMPFSASVPNQETAEEVLQDADIPWLVMTGTEDTSPVGDTTVEDRLAVFPALPAGDKYELVLFEGEHNAFTDGANGANGDRNPAHHPTIEALSTAFWDAYLLGDVAALQWLTGDGALGVLSEGDTWQFK